jgi:signal transduction histidine kinase
VSVGFESPDDLPNLIGDHNKLQQVTFNLLTNAVKFTPNGGTVRLRMNETDTGFMIAVIDTGIGIDPEDIPRVLQPFVQAESSDQRSHGGTGLGLPLSHSLVEMHGGKLQITSTKGVGTTVTVALPRDRIISKHIPLSQAG